MPLALLSLSANALPMAYRVGLALTVLILAFGLAMPNREGAWIATWWLYRRCHSWLPTAIVTGVEQRARIDAVSGALRATRLRPPVQLLSRAPALRSALRVPAAESDGTGILRLDPGGARAVMVLEGPACSPTADRYAEWSDCLLDWLTAVDCGAQLVTVVEHCDSRRAQEAFDARTHAWPRSPLLTLERSLAGSVAEQTTRFRHFVVLAPSLAGPDGLPYGCRLTRLSRPPEATYDSAARALENALRVAAGMDLQVRSADRDDISSLLGDSLIGVQSAAVARDGTLQLGAASVAMTTVIGLPPTLFPGVIVDALLRVRLRGVVSLHVMPVAAAEARRLLDRRAALHRYAAREGNDAVDNQVAMVDTARALASIAERRLVPCRVAVNVATVAENRDELAASTTRLDGLLSSRGFRVVRVTAPGFRPALAAAPGHAPLRRSVLLTSTDVAACLLPCLGTPFADVRQPLLGSCLATGAPAYLSLWSRPNHNALVVGSSGAGKSVAAKTLLVRHVMDGARAVVIDPDSEYRRVVTALRGRHFELGDDALNVLGACARTGPDAAASLVAPVLSVMAGDERGLRDGRAIRRLPDEDQGWLHGETADFFRTWRSQAPGREPLMSDLLAWLEDVSATRALTPRERERCAVIAARLRRFTQGHRAHVFDRQSTFNLDSAVTAVGLRAFAMAYAADLTPALAVVLTAILSMLRSERDTRPTVIVVDEAHRITSDPDAGEVLGQLVRQARKHAAGVWMCSQRVDDFIATDLGRTLAATASTKLVLGAEESSLRGIREVFGLDDEECSVLSPVQQGRGVLLSAGERAAVSIVPGPAILAVSETTPESVRLPAGTAG